LSIHPVYSRYFAHGQVTITSADGKSVAQKGNMIYEFPYSGNPDPRAHI
jgi:hypothetical protein